MSRAGNMKVPSKLLAIAAAIALQMSIASDNGLAQTPAGFPSLSNAMQLPPARLLGTPPVPPVIARGHAYPGLASDFDQGTRFDHLNPAGEPPTSWKHWWHPRRDMVQPNAYHPEAHGRYYMHPYNYKQLAVQQEFIRRVGGDPQNPYSNEIFKSLEEELAEQERVQEE